MIPPIAAPTIPESMFPSWLIPKTMKEGGALENEDTFSIIGASVADNFEVKMPEGTIGHSILGEIMLK